MNTPTEFKIDSPLEVYISSRKKFTLNLNVYRNTHYLVLNKAKIAYLNLVKHQLARMPRMKKCEVTFTLFWRNKTRCDFSNVCCIHDKFLMDSIVTLGKIADDDYAVYYKATYEFGGIDRANPRVVATIKG